MRLTRVRIEALRHFREPFEIRDLREGINLFVGPNGAGKTTIVRAIRAAFFERCKSGSVTDLLPWGEPGAAPSVEVDFATGGRRYHLRKRFLAKSRCSLDIDGTAFENSEAEERLADLLGFQYAGKGASKPEHWGVPGLLWIQQGGGQELHDAVGHATDHLRKALDESLGEVASTGGDEVFAQVRAERVKLLTPTGQATGELRIVAGLLAEANAKVASLAAQLATYRDQVDRFGLLHSQILSGNREQPWKRFQAQAKAAADQLDQIARMRDALTADRQILAQTEAQIRLLEQHQATFAEQAIRLAQRRQTLATAAALQADAELALLPRRQQLAAAQREHERTQAALGMAEQQERRRLQQERMAVLQQRHGSLQAVIGQGREILARLNRHRQDVAARRISDEQLATLRRNEQELQAASIRLEAVATTLSYRLDPGKSIELDEATLEGAGSTQLVTSAVLTIAQFGTLTIEPGGGQDLAKLSAARAALASTQDALLQSLGVDNLAAAEQRLQQRKAAEQDAQVAQARLDQLAPTGLDAQAAELAAVAGELADGQAKAASMEQAGGSQPGGSQPGGEQAAGTGELVCAPVSGVAPMLTVDDARSAHAEAATRWRTAQAAEQDARAAWAAAKGATVHAQAELSALQVTVEATDYRERVTQSQAELDLTRLRLVSLASRIRSAQQGIEAAQPQVLQQDADRFMRSATQAQQAHDQRREEVIGLQSQLDAAGANGLEEQLADAQGTLERMQRRHRELGRRAHALALLADMLQAKREALTQRLQAPLLARLNHYLHLLMPGARVTIDEALRPLALSRPIDTGAAGGFADLSFGTREQLGLISRLAYADLLKEANRPTLIILDDGLVNTDATRLSQMKRILYDAATRHQILLFSCHPERWADLGSGARDVLSLKRAPKPSVVAAGAPVSVDAPDPVSTTGG